MRSKFDLAYAFRRAAIQFPSAPAVDDGRRSLSLAEVVERGERLANALDGLGLEPGARVGVLMENRAEYVEVDVGLALARRVRVALNARLGFEDFHHMAADAGMAALVHSAGFDDVVARLAPELGMIAISVDATASAAPRLADLIDAADPTAVRRDDDPEGPAWISYTSGTTGKPKGVELSHRAIREVGFNLALELDVFRPGEQVVLPQPVSHGAGYFVLPALMAGGGVRLVDRFDPEEALALSRSERVRTLKIVPAMMDGLLAASAGRPLGYDHLIYGAAPIAAPVLERALERFGPVLTQIYGQSEAPATLTCLPAWAHEGDGEQRFSAGLPWRTVALEVCDPGGEPVAVGELGEVLIRGPHMMSGYRGLPEATAEVLDGGWLRTKDMARRDERGFVYLQGRRDEMINSGGFNISPGEVERVLVDHPDVEEAVVVGLPDERWGHAVNAAVRLRSGADASPEEVIGFVRPRLGFRTPKAVLIFDDIPRNTYGKVDRPTVVARLEGGAA
jgi:fatty-acyl-CoA synthase